MTFGRVVWVIVILLIASVLGAFIAHDFGHVRVVYSGWSLETSLWAALAAVMFVVVVGYLISKFIRVLVKGESILKGWVSNKHLSDSKKQTQKALELEFNGDAIEAIRTLVSAASHSQHAALHYLRASEIADRIGVPEEALELREKGTRTLGDMGKSILAYNDALRLISTGERRQGMRALLRLLEVHPSCAPALEIVVEQCMAAEDWVGALEYLDVLERLSYSNDESIGSLRKQCWEERLRQSEPDAVNKLWSSMPRKLRNDQELVEQYVRTLLRGDKQEECARFIEKSLKSQWSSPLAKLYGNIDGDAKKQVASAEAWLADHEDDSGLLLTLAQLHRRIAQTSEAIRYLNRCIESGGRLEAHLELAELNLHQGEREQALASLASAKATSVA